MLGMPEKSPLLRNGQRKDPDISEPEITVFITDIIRSFVFQIQDKTKLFEISLSK